MNKHQWFFSLLLIDSWRLNMSLPILKNYAMHMYREKDTYFQET